MSIITKYLASIFFRHLALCLTGFLALYLVVDFIEKISDFIEHQIPFSSIIMYFAAQIPNVLILLIPVATLASTLISLVLLARNSEIVAFKGSGVSLYRLSQPLLLSGLAISLCIFLTGNLITPYTAEIANRIWDGQVKNRRAEDQAMVVQDIWLKDIRLVQHMISYDENLGDAKGLTIIFLDEEMNLARRLEAAQGHFSPEGLFLSEVQEKLYTKAESGRPRAYRLIRRPELFLENWPMPPQGLGRHAETNTDELDISSLMDNINRLNTEGFNPVRQSVDLQFKFSRPFISLIMIIVGLPLGFWREKGGSVAVGLVLGLILSFFYLVGLELSRTMGYAGLIPPLMAAWLPNTFFLLLGLYLFSHVRQ